MFISILCILLFIYSFSNGANPISPRINKVFLFRMIKWPTASYICKRMSNVNLNHCFWWSCRNICLKYEMKWLSLMLGLPIKTPTTANSALKMRSHLSKAGQNDIWVGSPGISYKSFISKKTWDQIWRPYLHFLGPDLLAIIVKGTAWKS